MVMTLYTFLGQKKTGSVVHTHTHACTHTCAHTHVHTQNKFPVCS